MVLSEHAHSPHLVREQDQANPSPESDRAYRIAVAQTRLGYQQLPAGLGGTFIAAAVLTAVFWGKVALWQSLVWAILTIVILCGRAWGLRSYNRATTQETEHERWRQLFVTGAILSGCNWGIGATLFFVHESFLHLTFLTFILEGMAIGAIPSLSAVKQAIVGFVLPTTIPLAMQFFWMGDLLSLGMGVMSAMFGGFACVVALRYHATITESLTLRFDTHELRESKDALQQSHDILEQRVHERTLALQQEVVDRTRSEAHTRAMLEAIPDAVFRLNHDGLFLEYKAAHRSLLPVPGSFFSGKRLTDVVPSEVARQGLAVIAKALRTGDAQGFEYRLSIDGKVREFEARLAVCGADEIVALVRDITQQKEVERLKEELVSTVSHELRTPLTSLRGFTELLLTRSFPRDKQQEMLMIMKREAVRLSSLINDFLDLRRMEAGQIVYEWAPVQLEALLQQSLEPFLNGNGTHSFRLTVPQPLPPVNADASRIQQVLTNLLSNAVKFSPSGGEIVLGAERRGDEVVIWVKDHGMGIAPDVLPRIFDRFFRADNSTTRTIGGTGLGLALVKEIVVVHKGRVWVDSMVDQGSTFFVALPLSPSVAEVSQ